MYYMYHIVYSVWINGVVPTINEKKKYPFYIV